MVRRRTVLESAAAVGLGGGLAGCSSLGDLFGAPSGGSEPAGTKGWAGLRGDARNSGAIPGKGPGDGATADWKTDLGAGAFGSPSAPQVDEDSLYVIVPYHRRGADPPRSGVDLVALARTDGTERWRRQLVTTIEKGEGTEVANISERSYRVTRGPDAIYTAITAGVEFDLHLAKVSTGGTVRWRQVRPGPANDFVGPVVADGRLFLDFDSIVAYDTDSGEETWSVKGPDRIMMSSLPAATADRLVTVQSTPADGLSVSCRNTGSGRVCWRTKLGDRAVRTFPTIAKHLVIVPEGQFFPAKVPHAE